MVPDAVQMQHTGHYYHNNNYALSGLMGKLTEYTMHVKKP